MDHRISRRVAVLVAAASIAFALLTGCASVASPSYTAGTYTATAEGKNGPVTVEVTFTGTAISSIKVLEHAETPGLSDPAIKRVPAAIVAGQSLAVDSVAGATYTSAAIQEAVEKAVRQAGGDVAGLKRKAAARKAGKTEEYAADVVVIGAGAAGINAAMETARLGASVVLLEKGGNINVSNGANCGGPAAAGTRLQAAEGETVSVETLFSHMVEYADWKINASLLRNVLALTGSTIDNFQDMGIEMFLRPDNYGMGFRARHGFKTPKGKRFDFIAADIEKHGGTIMLETAGKELIVEDGRVVGVKAVKADGTNVIIMAKAVVVATGGYLGDQEKISEYFQGVHVNPLGNTLSVGDGIDMMTAAGAVLDWASFGMIANEFTGTNRKAGPWDRNVENMTWPIYGGLIVDSRGQRFMDEGIMAREPLSVGGGLTMRAGNFYSVIDQEYFDAVRTVGIYSHLGEPASWYAGKAQLKGKKLAKVADQLQDAIDKGWAYKADTVEELAEKFGLGALPATVAEYNAYCVAGKDERFYKDPAFLKPVSKGPFYVFEYENSAWGTLGGVKTDDGLRVLDGKNQPIPGLYAAGVDAGSLYSGPYYDNEGAAVGLAYASGRYAAQEIVKALAK